MKFLPNINSSFGLSSLGVVVFSMDSKEGFTSWGFVVLAAEAWSAYVLRHRCTARNREHGNFALLEAERVRERRRELLGSILERI